MAEKSIAKRVEIALENLLFSSRWLLAPFYFGLALALVILLIKFLAELVHLGTGAFTSTESDVILGLLTLVDLTLTGSLLIIVIFSGYENFVSKMDHSEHGDRPEWMGTIDFAALKLKMLSSIVAISAVQLLRQFMSLGSVTPEREKELFWLVVIHIVFVVSSVLLALSDRIAGHQPGHNTPLADDTASNASNTTKSGTH
ncbi:TIGR00645 family protein [Hyphomicrobium methylovorum]|uniref:TIGR00645 family protein n=1 Tax=Hyphomicrobium methylovorum TaxID=84 RepID=UPI0015E7C9AC|nr:TIGR00645 family protein [Hyphomicrobium methylovorum]MBA2126022.1 TIGR00645 family protein [Hyphomicrobium methylovorum]